MIEKLDGARVLMLSEKGCFGYLEIQGQKKHRYIDISYLAICQYDKSDKVYLFLCNKNMEVENDWEFDHIEEAISNAQSRSQFPIVWLYPNNT